jgi:cobalamin biosynthesis Mg chelatase CobN
MILNTRIFNSVVETARTKSANNPALLRAIDRAVCEINRSRYWAYDGKANVLRIQSTTSRKLYIVDDAHTCEATANGHKACKHLVARRLLQRYTEACAASAVVCERSRVQNWSVKEGHAVREFARVNHIPAPSRMAEAAAAPLMRRTIKGEKCGGVDI